MRAHASGRSGLADRERDRCETVGFAEVTTVGQVMNRIPVAVSARSQRHARWRDPTEAETAAAVAELQEIIAAGTTGPRCWLSWRASGADLDLIPQWVERGTASRLDRPPDALYRRAPPVPVGGAVTMSLNLG
jgi:hypothetical protein